MGTALPVLPLLYYPAEPSAKQLLVIQLSAAQLLSKQLFNCLQKSCYQYSCLTAELLHLVHMNKYSTEALTYALHASSCIHCFPEAKADYHYFISQLMAKSILHHIPD